VFGSSIKVLVSSDDLLLELNSSTLFILFAQLESSFEFIFIDFVDKFLLLVFEIVQIFDDSMTKEWFDNIVQWTKQLALIDSNTMFFSFLLCVVDTFLVQMLKFGFSRIEFVFF